MQRPRLRRNSRYPSLVRLQPIPRHMRLQPIPRLPLSRKQFQRLRLLYRFPPRLLRGQRPPQRCQLLRHGNQRSLQLFPRLLLLQGTRPRTHPGLPLRHNRQQRVRPRVARHLQDVQDRPARNRLQRALRPQLLVLQHAHKFRPARCPPATAVQFPARCRAAASARAGHVPDSRCVRNSPDRVGDHIRRALVVQVARAEQDVHLDRDLARHRRDRVPARARPAGQGCCRHFQKKCR